jgi:hypothetical protein
MINSKRMRGAECIAPMARREFIHYVDVNIRKKDIIGGKIILNFILEKCNWMV